MEFKTTCQKLAKLLIMVGAASNIITLIKADNVVSHSFISTGSTSQPDPLFYRNFWQPNNIPNGKQKNFSITPFYSRSTNSKRLARYFSPFDKDELVVREDGTNMLGGADTDGSSQDILSYNFNLTTVNQNFHSVIKFKPQREIIGSDFVFFAQHCNKLWASLSTQISHVKTNMHLTETVVNTGGGADGTFAGFFIDGAREVGTMKDAFKQSQMLYGKIDGSQGKTGLSDITLTAGYNWKRESDFYLQPFVGTVLPTSGKPKGHYVFEPVLGNNGHFALFSGIHYGTVLKENSKKSMLLHGTTQTTYRFANTQKRSFDPAGNPWGRYIAVHNNPTDMANLVYRFGVNQFTKDVRVSPYFTHDSHIDLAIYTSKCSYNFGYKLHIQNAEKVILFDQWNNPAISLLDNATNSTLPTRKINDHFDSRRPATPQFIPVTIQDLDLNSAAQPSSIQHTGSVNLSRKVHHQNRDYNLLLGTSYTYTQSNKALSSWNLWIGLSTNL